MKMCGMTITKTLSKIFCSAKSVGDYLN